MRRPEITLRYENQAQINKFKAAAKLCRWSLNTFVLAGADRLAEIALAKLEPEVLRELLNESSAIEHKGEKATDFA